MAKFEKGVSGNPAGRPKNSQNKVTMSIKEVFSGVLEAYSTDDILKIIAKIDDPKDQIAAITKIAEFVAPKMRSVDLPQVEKLSNPVIDLINEVRDEQAKK